MYSHILLGRVVYIGNGLKYNLAWRSDQRVKVQYILRGSGDDCDVRYSFNEAQIRMGMYTRYRMSASQGRSSCLYISNAETF